MNQLTRTFNLAFGLAIVIGGTIGVGILRTPGIVAANLGSMWPIIGVWAFGGVYALIGANTFAELATMLPKAGGTYVYIRRAYGDFFGFAGGMNDFILNCCGAAYIAIVSGEYFVALFPVAGLSENFIAVAVLLALFALNLTGVRAGDWSQKLIGLVKVAAFAILIAACFIFGSNAWHSVARPASQLTAPLALAGALALSLQPVMETYAGWNSVVYFSEENIDPARSIPRALFGGVMVIATIYILVNAALLYALPASAIASSKLPAADAATAIFGAMGGKLITVLALASLVGTLNAMVMYIPRVLYAMSRDGFLPSQGAAVNRGGTPSVALFATVALTTVFAATGSFETLLAIAAFLGLANDSAVYLALFVLRSREPNLERPFRAAGYPVLPAAVLVGGWILLGLYVVGNTVNSLYSIGILVLLYPVYILSRKISGTRP